MLNKRTLISAQFSLVTIVLALIEIGIYLTIVLVANEVSLLVCLSFR